MALYLCKLVAEAHGGRIDYEAAPDGPSFVMRHGTCKDAG